MRHKRYHQGVERNALCLRAGDQPRVERTRHPLHKAPADRRKRPGNDPTPMPHLNVRFQPHAPIPGLLMQVCDCDNYDLDACRLIDQAIGKPLHLTTANRATQRVPCQRKIVDTPDGLPGLITKLVPQPNALRVVVPDCFNKLLMRGRQESSLQTFFPRSAKTRSASIAPSSPAR